MSDPRIIIRTPGIQGPRGLVGPQGDQGEKGDPGGASPTDVADAITTPGPAQTALNNAIATGAATVVRDRRPVPTSAAVVFTWDDGYIDQWSNARPLANALGQRHSFFIHTADIGGGNKMTAAQIQTLHAEGHEIGSHSIHHNATGFIKDLTVPERVAEYEQSKTVLEGILGPNTVTSWAYPKSQDSRNDITDRELWGRYARVMVSASPRLGLSAPGRTGFLVSRQNWDPISHETVLSQIRMIRETGMTLCLSAHRPGGAGDLSLAQMQEAMNLVHELGIPTLTTREAFPAAGAGLANPSFEEGLAGWAISKGVGGTSTATAHTGQVAPGIKGSKYLRLITDGEAGDRWIFATQAVPVIPGTQYALSFRMRSIRTSGPGRPTVRFWPTSYAPVAPTPGSETVVTLEETAPDPGDTYGWERRVATYDVPADCPGVRIDIRIPPNYFGEMRVDHLHWGPSALGAFG